MGAIDFEFRLECFRSYEEGINVNASFLFIISPVANLDEAALRELESALPRELGAISVQQRNVRGQTNCFFRGSDSESKPQFLWLMQLDFVDGATGTVGSALTAAIHQAKAALEPRHATVSAAFKLNDLPV